MKTTDQTIYNFIMENKNYPPEEIGYLLNINAQKVRNFFRHHGIALARNRINNQMIRKQLIYIRKNILKIGYQY